MTGGAAGAVGMERPAGRRGETGPKPDRVRSGPRREVAPERGARPTDAADGGSRSAVRRPAARRLRRAVLAGAGGAVLVLGTAAPAAQAGPAADGYRYWSFWDRDGDSWVYATKGPGIARPSDGDVHGVRFAVSEESGGGPRPRGAADFETVCGDTEPDDGDKRVALVIDFGSAAHAPDGQAPPPARTECASVPPDATLGEALAAVAEPLRYDSAGLLCAIDGYPRSGCAEPASGSGGGDGDAAGEPRGEVTASAAADEAGGDDGDSGPSTGTVGGVAVVAVLAGLTVWQLRRRRT